MPPRRTPRLGRKSSALSCASCGALRAAPRARSLRRNELRHVQIVSPGSPRRAPAAPPRDAATGPGLIEPRGHAAVREAHVAQQALGVVAQRDGELAQVARELGALAQTSRATTWDSPTISRASSRALARDALGLLGGIGAQLLEILAAGRDGALGLRVRLGDSAPACRGLGEQRSASALGAGERLLGLRARTRRAPAGPARSCPSASARSPRGRSRARAGVAARRLTLLLGFALGARAQLLGLGLGVGAHPLGLGVDAADGGDGVVACALGLRARLREQLVGLLFGGVHAVGGGAVGLGDALARAILGLLAQLGGRAFGRVHDFGDPRRRTSSRPAVDRRRGGAPMRAFRAPSRHRRPRAGVERTRSREHVAWQKML